MGIEEKRERLRAALIASKNTSFNVEDIHTKLKIRIPKHYIDREEALSFEGSNIHRGMDDNDHVTWTFKPPNDDNLDDTITRTKHGGGGESDDHRNLKEYVQKNPDAIGQGALGRKPGEQSIKVAFPSGHR